MVCEPSLLILKVTLPLVAVAAETLQSVSVELTFSTLPAAGAAVCSVAVSAQPLSSSAPAAMVAAVLAALVCFFMVFSFCNLP